MRSENPERRGIFVEFLCLTRPGGSHSIEVAFLVCTQKYPERTGSRLET